MSDPSVSTPASGGPRPAMPFRLNLEQQRKRARELLRQLRGGEAGAWQRFRLHHPSAMADGTAAMTRLSEAQLVIARELGLPSWPRLKAHIEAMERSWASIRRGGDAPDRDMPTLHLRCGSDIGPALWEAGFAGDFLEYSDPFCQGPVLPGPDWLEQRAEFLARSYGAGTGMNRNDVTTKLRQAEEALADAPVRYQRIVLWFEHDTYDQLILARCLAHFAGAAPACLELVSPARYPGAARFIGLGQLPPEALRLLWEKRASVPEEALHSGRMVWDALRQPAPGRLADLGRAGTAGIPQLGRAVLRHCRELPWVEDGLSLTERLILQLLAEEPQSVGQVFERLMLEREPLPWMTDLMIRDTVERMRRVRQPVFLGSFRDGKDGWPQEQLAITPLGRAVLARGVDWMSLAPPARWVGGVPIGGAEAVWRWDDCSSSVRLMEDRLSGTA